MQIIQNNLKQEFNNIIGLFKSVKRKVINNEMIYLYPETEREVVFAILNGYLQDKEIELFLKQFISIKNSTVRYSVKKLLCKFKVTSRTELFRILLCSDFVFHVPKSIYTKINNNNFDLHVVVF